MDEDSPSGVSEDAAMSSIFGGGKDDFCNAGAALPKKQQKQVSKARSNPKKKKQAPRPKSGQGKAGKSKSNRANRPAKSTKPTKLNDGLGPHLPSGHPLGPDQPRVDESEEDEALPHQPGSHRVDDMEGNIDDTTLEPGLVHQSGERLADHILVRYGTIRQKQKQFLSNLANMSCANMEGVQSAFDSRQDNEYLTSHILEKAVGGEAAALSDTLYEQCEQDLRHLGSLLHQAPQNSLTTNPDQQTLSVHSHVKMVSRAWEEGFLHEASGCERPCVNHASRTCFASLIENNAVLDPTFALVEFYLPDEYKAIEKAGWVWPANLRPCLLCLRNMIFSHLFNVRCNNSAVTRSVSYASIGNFVGLPGEYCVENVFISRPDVYEGVSVPVVIPCTADYEVSVLNGIRWHSDASAAPKPKKMSGL